MVLAVEHSTSLGSVEFYPGRQVAGAAEWERECGRMEGGRRVRERARERGNHIRGLVAVINGG